MVFQEIPLPGAYCITLEKKEDERGFFARVFCSNELEQLNLDHTILQINNSLSRKKGTLRGMHYQLPPKSEVKIVRCICGSLFDVIIDLRPESPTFGKWYGIELSAENRTMLYVPKSFAHGFITLEDNTEIIYLVTEFFSPQFERGIRWNDKKFNIRWPLEPSAISDKDRNHPDFNPDYHLK